MPSAWLRRILLSLQENSLFYFFVFPWQSAMNTVIVRAVEQAGLPFNPAKVN